ncbi:MAG: redox-regulated ATPase YchF, partial [Kiritimatiellae bacterium]|nr:redox-regulated ATPase YchF [Kiritimatiellia bacterium]
MSLNLYLIGPQGAGKTAVFDALAQTPDGLHCSSKGAHRIGTVKVPDARLAALRDIFLPKKYIPAEVTFVDVALGAHAGKENNGFAALNAFLGEADAFALVVQTFGDTDYQGRPLDPAAQLESTLLDLAMADLEKIERRIEKIEQELKRGLKQSLPELAVLQKCKEAIDAGKALRDLELSAEDWKHVSSFCFLSQKPVLVIANTPDSDVAGEIAAASLRAAAEAAGLPVLAFCAPLEAEIAALPPEDQASFLADYGIESPARDRLIRAAYKTLRLVSFFTVGPDEVR